MWDFLSFRRMLMPYLIQAFFWAGTALCIFQGFLVMAGRGMPMPLWRHAPGSDTSPLPGSYAIVVGLVIMIGGPLMLRLWCEVLIVIFRINETLTDMSGGGAKGKK